MTDEPRTTAAGDGRFLADLLGGIARRAQALEVELAGLAQLDRERAAERGAALEAERELLGWGLVVAAGLLGADGAPARRERRGPAWLADLVGLPAHATPDAWPPLRREAADWALAHALVRWPFEAALAGGSAPRLRAGPTAEHRAWTIDGAREAPPAALVDQLARDLPGARASDGDPWTLLLPAASFAKGGP